MEICAGSLIMMRAAVRNRGEQMTAMAGAQMQIMNAATAIARASVASKPAEGETACACSLLMPLEPEIEERAVGAGEHLGAGEREQDSRHRNSQRQSQHFRNPSGQRLI